jgi:glutamyl-tRNA synthetase
MSEIKVRFAPSPTGYVHVGSLRTALYNYLFARHFGGTLVLRIEDTDQSRFVEGAVENLIRTLEWAGIDYDEGPAVGGAHGPYFQSERLNIYRELVNELVVGGYAYPCFCSTERLDALREERLAKGEPPGMYDRKCRSLSPEDAQIRMKSATYTIRMRIPDEGETVFEDLVREEVRFDHSVLDDQILLKSDGYPTYHLANVIDDHLMGITHVIRGEEWLPSTPKHVLLYSFFGWKMPRFAHLPLLLNADRSKLSKRQGDVAVEDYKRKGILPEALLNFVALLGWSPGEDDKELFNLEELIQAFSLERVNKSGAVFDMDKLEWMNGMYIRSCSEDAYLHNAIQWFSENVRPLEADDLNRQIMLSVRERINTLGELKEKTALFFEDTLTYYSESALEWIQQDSSKELLKILLQELEKFSDISLDDFKHMMKSVQQRSGVKGKELWMPVRAAITGMTEGPELPIVIQILGKTKVSAFVEQAINR